MINKQSQESTNSLLKRADFNAETGEIRIAGEDWILMSASTFRDLVKGTENILASNAVIVWLAAGRQAGREFSGNLVKLKMEFEELPPALEEFFTEGGWGKIQANADFTKKEALVTVRNCATARHVTREEPVCHFVRGFIAGVCDVMFHCMMECSETKCIAKGDAYCEFQARRRQPC